MKPKYLHIELMSEYTLDFKINDTPLADCWLERMSLRDPYPLDHPDRFYGFNSQEQEIARAEKMMQQCISTINAYQPIIEREFTSVHDQDCLNYMHSIFEKYHGLLNQQKTIWWFRAPTPVKKALAELNLAVHRCEASIRFVQPRIICTWYGLPKTETLPESIMEEFGELQPKFGSVCLQYVEIGKTLLNLTTDDDQHISDEAFQPFNYYNPDFVVRFGEIANNDLTDTMHSMYRYYQKHYDFFASKGFTKFNHVKLLPLHFPVAQLIERVDREQLIKEVQQRQFITDVYIDKTMHH